MTTKQYERGASHGSFLTVGRNAVVLVLSLLLVLGALGPLGFYFCGAAGLLASVVAMAICLACGLVGLAVSQLFRRPQYVLHQIALTMLVRMGIPLVVCMLIYFRRGPLMDAGFVYYLLAFYLATLLVDTSLAIVAQGAGKPPSSNAVEVS